MESPFNEMLFMYNDDLREQFRRGALREEWERRYRNLFTAIDASIARNQPRRHFFEWLGAILIYEATGYLSCLKWDCGNHREARARFCELAEPEFAKAVLAASTGYPDLIAYAPDSSDWFFCEVKGDKDRIGPKQVSAARTILKATGRRVVLLHLRPVRV